MQTADPPSSFSFLCFLGSLRVGILRASNEIRSLLKVDFDFNLSYVGEIFDKKIDEIQWCFSKMWTGEVGGEGRAAQRFVFHANYFGVIFTEDMQGVIFLSFSRADINFHG